MAAFSFLKNWFAPQFDAKIAPDHEFAVIGDIHGRADLLADLLQRIRDHAGSGIALVLVGDYVDRGEDSAEVIRVIRALQAGGWPAKVTCLRGNHEDMLLGFLDDPEGAGASWLHYGGKQTLLSFAVSLPEANEISYRKARDDLRCALGREAELWMRNLPVSFQCGNIFVSHAGANPHLPLAEQQERHLIWGHSDFLQTPRTDGNWVVHGHNIHDEPLAARGRIAVDTGGYATNRLTAAILRDGACEFIATS